MEHAKPTRSQRLREKSAERRAQRKAETRSAILDAAAELFREGGFERFSLRQVAEATGYSPTTIYLYFDDKDDLLFHVALHGFRRFGEMLQAAYDGSDEPLERLRALGRAYLLFGLDHPVHYRLMFMQRGEFLERTPPEGYDAFIDSFGVLVRVVRECQEARLVEEGDPMDLAMLIWTGVHGIVGLAVATPYLDRSRALAMQERSSDVLLDGIRR